MLKCLALIASALLLMGGSSAPFNEHSRLAKDGIQAQSQTAARDEEQAKGFWEKTTADPVAAYTGVLALLTACLVIVSTVQIWFLVRADKRAAEASNAMRRQAEWAGEQTDIARVQKDIARLQYFAEHRPRIVLKEAFFTDPLLFDEVTYELANMGASEGQIIEGFIGVGFIDDFREFRTGVQAVKLQAPFTIGPGNAILKTLTPPPNASAVMRLTTAQGLGRRGDLSLYGRLTYVDGRGEEFGVQRVSVFRRTWDRESSRFVRTGDPDHEYSD